MNWALTNSALSRLSVVESTCVVAESIGVVGDIKSFLYNKKSRDDAINRHGPGDTSLVSSSPRSVYHKS